MNATADRGLGVLGEPPVASEPGDTPVDHLSLRMDGEANLIRRLADDLDGDAGGFGDAVTSIRGVGESAFDERKAGARGLRQRHDSVAVLDQGGLHLHAKQPTVDVGHRMPRSGRR